VGRLNGVTIFAKTKHGNLARFNIGPGFETDPSTKSLALMLTRLLVLSDDRARVLLSGTNPLPVLVTHMVDLDTGKDTTNMSQADLWLQAHDTGVQIVPQNGAVLKSDATFEGITHEHVRSRPFPPQNPTAKELANSIVLLKTREGRYAKAMVELMADTLVVRRIVLWESTGAVLVTPGISAVHADKDPYWDVDTMQAGSRPDAGPQFDFSWKGKDGGLVVHPGAAAAVLRTLDP
jgi:hypothetical protein